MPSQSKQQQKFMGMVHALKKGNMNPSDASPEVKKAAQSMSGKDAKDFAATNHQGLPRKVKQEILHKLKEYANKMGTNTMGGDDYTSSKKGGLRDNDGYDNVDYNKDMPMDESMMSTLDQIKKDSKSVKDFIKNVLLDRNFKDMKSDKDFIKYLGSIYEGKLPTNWMQGRVSDYHTQLRGKKKDYSGGTNFKKDNSGQIDLEEISPKTIHKLADKKGIKWDNEPSFLKLTKQLTGKNHLDNLNQKELNIVKQYLEKQNSDISIQEENPCWVGYKQVGMKNKGGRQVPNCVKESVDEYAQRLDFSYLVDDEAMLDGTPPPKDAINRDLNETMIRKAADIAHKLLPKDTFSRYGKDGQKNQEFVKNIVRDLTQSLNKFYKNHDISVRIRENQEDSNVDMVLGVLSILRQIDDKENRNKVAVDMIRKFKEQDIDFDYQEFLELMREYNNTSLGVKEGVSTPAKRDYKAEYKKFQSSTKSKKYRAELNKYNRDKGTYGNGDGKDASHKGGKISGFETESKNRGRREKSRLKKK